MSAADVMYGSGLAILFLALPVVFSTAVCGLIYALGGFGRADMPEEES